MLISFCSREDEDEDEGEDEEEEEEEEKEGNPIQKLPIDHPLRQPKYQFQLYLLEQQSVRTQWRIKLDKSKNSPAMLNGRVYDDWEEEYHHR